MTFNDRELFDDLMEHYHLVSWQEELNTIKIKGDDIMNNIVDELMITVDTHMFRIVEDHMNFIDGIIVEAVDEADAMDKYLSELNLKNCFVRLDGNKFTVDKYYPEIGKTSGNIFSGKVNMLN